MPGDPKPNEWNSLKEQFDALVHDESVGADSIEKIFDVQFCRRFAELLNRAADPTRTGTSAGSRVFHRHHFVRHFKMNQRDQELLDKELWGVSPSPPRNGGIIGVALVVVFLAGIAIGDILFAHDSKQIQIASHDAAAAISFLNVVPPTMR
jgi:hypothetical protein